MLKNGRLRRLIEVSQLLVRRNEAESITLLVAKLSDGFLNAGHFTTIEDFPRDL